MPIGLLAAGIVPGQNFEGRILSKGTVQVTDFAVYFNGQGIAGQALTDAGGEVVASGAGLDLADGAIGEGDVEHNYCLQVSAKQAQVTPARQELGSTALGHNATGGLLATAWGRYYWGWGHRRPAIISSGWTQAIGQ